MPGRVSIGKSTHGLTAANGYSGNQSLVPSNTANTQGARPKKSVAKTTLLCPIPTWFLPKPIARPLTALERAVLALDPIKPLKAAAKAVGNAVKSAAKAVVNTVKKIFSGW